MCTSVSFTTKDHYFGRTLDMECSYNEKVIITPRNYNFKFRMSGELTNHYAIIGIGAVVDNYPLYYDATNEKGLSVAGLNFPVSAKFSESVNDKNCVIKRQRQLKKAGNRVGYEGDLAEDKVCTHIDDHCRNNGDHYYGTLYP